MTLLAVEARKALEDTHGNVDRAFTLLSGVASPGPVRCTRNLPNLAFLVDGCAALLW